MINSKPHHTPRFARSMDDFNSRSHLQISPLHEDNLGLGSLRSPAKAFVSPWQVGEFTPAIDVNDSLIRTHEAGEMLQWHAFL